MNLTPFTESYQVLAKSCTWKLMGKLLKADPSFFLLYFKTHKILFKKAANELKHCRVLPPGKTSKNWISSKEQDKKSAFHMQLWFKQKCCTQCASKLGKLSSGHRTGKAQFSFKSQRKAMPKNVQTTAQLFISHASKLILKLLQAGLQQYVNQ